LPTNILGSFLQIEISVYPDDFYGCFFSTLLENPPEGIGLKEIREAHEETLKSDFSIFRRIIS